MKNISNPYPFFMSSGHGKLFALFYQAKVDSRAVTSVGQGPVILHIPAFAEEMNKSRRMVSQQAKVLCEQGFSVLVFDLFGTGDSEGDFSEASWAIWLQNIESALEWLKLKEYQSVSLWGLRTGALLVMDFIRHHQTIKIDRLICWQPVLKGELFILQFLRLRIAAAMMGDKVPREKISDLKAALEAGNSIEVAGYGLNPELVLPIMDINVLQLDLSNVTACNVFEVVAQKGQQVARLTQQWIENLSRKKLTVSLDLINGSAFWATQEIVEAPDLIAATTNRLIRGKNG